MKPIDFIIDDASVDYFSAMMKHKLAECRNKGRSGWYDENQCSVDDLANLLIEHLHKTNAGNFVDIANLVMMLHQREAPPDIISNKLHFGS